MNAFCEKCGSPLSPGAAFCSSCGQRVGVTAEVQNPSGYTPQPQYAQPQYAQPQYAPPQYTPAPKSNKTLIIVLAAVFALAAIAVALVLLLGGPAIPPEELNGEWSGTLILEQISDEAEELLGLTQDYIGDEESMGINIALFKDGKGRMLADQYECDATYQGGTLVAQSSDVMTGMSLHMSGTPSRNGDSYSLRGTWKFTDNSGKVIASGSWTANK